MLFDRKRKSINKVRINWGVELRIALFTSAILLILSTFSLW